MREKIKGPFSYKVAKAVLTQADIERLACAFLATENISQFDADKAALEFGGVKPDSFKRGIWVITKKINEAMANGFDGGESAEGGRVITPKSASKKRKVGGEMSAEGSAAKKKPKASSVGGKAKKARSEIDQSDDGDKQGNGAVGVKSENGVHGVEHASDDDDWMN